MILFLDFDGVLHSFPAPKDSSHLFHNLPRLENVLRDYPNTQIVISSTWREDHSLKKLAMLFSADIRNRIKGVLPIISIQGLADIESIRFREINQYLKDRPSDWIALDDDPALFPPNCPNLIQCTDGFGIAEEEKLRKILTKTS